MLVGLVLAAATALVMSADAAPTASITGSSIVVSVAGTWDQKDSGDGGLAIKASLNFPEQVASDRDGNLFFAEFFGDRVRKIDPHGTISTVAGGGYELEGPALQTEINRPGALAIDSRGDVFVGTDHMVKELFPNGTVVRYAGFNPSFTCEAPYGNQVKYAEFHGVSGLAEDAADNLYVVDSYNGCIYKLTPTGTITVIAGVNGNTGNTGDGGVATSAQLLDPAGISFDGHGNLYVAEYGADRVREITTAGVITTVAGTTRGFSGDGGLAIHAQLSHPTDVVVDDAGNLYIADWGNNRIRRVDTKGMISTIAGGKPTDREPNPKRPLRTIGDGGPVSKAWVFAPVWLAFDRSGNLLVSSGGSYRIRKILTTAPGKGKKPTPKAKRCTIDYCLPPAWNARVPRDSPVQGDEPLNVIVSAASTVGIDTILGALGVDKEDWWAQVPALGQPHGCLSVETANLNGKGFTRQASQWRLGGCIHGNELSITGSENHARLWPQNVPPPNGKRAWFVAASLETACILQRDGALVTVAHHVTSLPEGKLWHCVDGGPGSFGSEGYDLGARLFVHDVCRAAKNSRLHAWYRKDKRPAGTGQGKVRYSGYVYVLTVSNKPPSLSAPSKGITSCGA